MKHLFPYSRVPAGSKIVIYGVGDVGSAYIKEIAGNRYCDILFALDKKNIDLICNIHVYRPEHLRISERDYDYIVIANANSNIADEIEDTLLSYLVPQDKIIWDYHSGSSKSFNVYEKRENAVDLFEIMKAIEGKQVVLYGAGRGALDFLYIFNEIEVKYCICEENAIQAKTIPLRKMPKETLHSEDKDNIYVIVVGYDEGCITNYLDQIGYRYGMNWCWASDYVKFLDLPKISLQKRLLFCYSRKGYREISRFIKYYGEFPNAEIISDDEIFEVEMDPKDGCVVLFGNDNEKAINSLLNKNYDYGKDFVEWNSTIQLPSRLYYEMSISLPTDIPQCTKIIDYAEYAGRYDEFIEVLCCPAHIVTYDIGRIDIQSPKQAWKSNLAKVSRLCVVNGTYTCCTDICPYIVHYKKQFEFKHSAEWITDESRYTKTIPDSPQNVSINIDYSCNLNCKFCRPEKWIATGEKREKMFAVAEMLEADVLPNVNIINLAGDGEVFFSPVYRKMLYDQRNKGKILRIVSNGTLLDRADFEMLKEIYSELRLCVSLGTFSKEIYEDYWRGAKWEVIIRNLEQMGNLRREGILKVYDIYYLVTTDTYRDLPEFIVWAEANHIDMVSLQRLHVGGVFREEEYNRLTLYDSRGEMKKEYRDFFEQDIFKHKIINWGNLL